MKLYLRFLSGVSGLGFSTLHKIKFENYSNRSFQLQNFTNLQITCTTTTITLIRITIFRGFLCASSPFVTMPENVGIKATCSIRCQTSAGKRVAPANIDGFSGILSEQSGLTRLHQGRVLCDRFAAINNKVLSLCLVLSQF